MYSVSDDILVDRSYTMSRFSARIFLFFFHTNCRRIKNNLHDRTHKLFSRQRINPFVLFAAFVSHFLPTCILVLASPTTKWHGITYNDKHPYWMKIFHFPTKGIYSHRERSSDEIENNKQHFLHLHKSQTPEQRLKLTCLE